MDTVWSLGVAFHQGLAERGKNNEKKLVQDLTLVYVPGNLVDQDKTSTWLGREIVLQGSTRDGNQNMWKFGMQDNINKIDMIYKQSTDVHGF